MFHVGFYYVKQENCIRGWIEMIPRNNLHSLTHSHKQWLAFQQAQVAIDHTLSYLDGHYNGATRQISKVMSWRKKKFNS